MQTTPSFTRPRRLGLVYGAEILTGLGEGVFWVGPIVAISGSASFNARLTSAVVVRLAPRALFSLPAGTLVDHTNVRNVLVTTDLAPGVVMVSLGIAGRWSLIKPDVNNSEG